MRIKEGKRQLETVVVTEHDDPHTVIDAIFWLDDNFNSVITDQSRFIWRRSGPSHNDIVNVRNLPRTARTFGSHFEVQTHATPTELELGLVGLGVDRIENGRSSQLLMINILLRRLDVCRAALESTE